MKSFVKSTVLIFGFLAAFALAACKVSVNPKDSKPKYTVEFNSMGGSPVESQTVKKGDKAAKPQEPTKPDSATEIFVFENWYTSTDGGSTLSESPFDFNTSINENFCLYAKWNIFSPEFKIPLTLEFISSGTVTVDNPWSTLKYSKNGGVLHDYSGDITTAVGDKICLYAQESENTSIRRMIIHCSSDCYIYGNMMSLVTLDSLSGEWNPYASSVQSQAFYNLFSNNTNIKNHAEKKVYLSATTLAESCYQFMFRGCTNLTKAPELPSIILAYDCYGYMFDGCTSLTTAPDLPATTLAESCYQFMFRGCISLTRAPELPATTLAINCYRCMFNGCTSLTNAPELPATILATYCYSYMFYSCTSLTNAPELPATILAASCYSYMFYGCTNLTKAPELPSIILAYNCYGNMFEGCTSLTTAPELPATMLAKSCYYSMYKGCKKLNSIKCLATDISAENCTLDWLSGVSQTGTFKKAASMNNWTTGTSGIPSGWTVQDAN